MKTDLNWLFYESGLKNIRCMACHKMGDQKFDRVNNIDNPNTIRWIKQDELIITTGFIFADDEKEQIKLIDELKEVGCAGLGIKIKSFFKEIPECMIAEAEKVGLPLFEIPYYYSLSDVSRVIYNHIYELDHLDKLKEQHLIEDISELFFSKHAVMEIVLKVSEYVRRTVLFIDDDFNCIYTAKRKKDRELCTSGSHIEKISFSSKNNVQILFPNGEIRSSYIVQIENTEFELVVIEEERVLSIAEKKTLDHCCLIISMSLLRTKKTYSDEYEIENENNERLYDVFCANREITDENLFRICSEYHIRLEEKRVLLLIQLQKNNQFSLSEIFRFLCQEVRTKEYISEQSVIPFYHGNSLFILLLEQENDTAADLKKRVLRLETELKETIESIYEGVEAAFGISRCSSNKQGLLNAAHEAERAISIGKRIGAAKEVYDFREYVFYDHLLKNPEEKNYYRNGNFEILVQYDAENHTEYVDTLMMYFACLFNASETSKRLFIHRNTLLKRLNKIKGLLQVELNDMDEFMMLYMEMCAYKLYS